MPDPRATIAARRRKLDLSPGEVARRAGVSRQAYVQFEEGKGRDVQLGTLARYAAAVQMRLDVRLVELVEVDGDGDNF